jgi:hypothetical protein
MLDYVELAAISRAILQQQKIIQFFSVGKIKLSTCLINQAPLHDDIWGSGGIASPFLT